MCETKQSSITALVVDRYWNGSCNGCTNREDDKVVQVELRGYTFRLCKSCAKELKDRLTTILKGSL